MVFAEDGSGPRFDEEGEGLKVGLAHQAFQPLHFLFDLGLRALTPLNLVL
jgi:hypothetical protein